MLALDQLFSEGAVLQRGKKICVWGTGDDGRKVSVSLQGQEAGAVVEHGRWSAWLQPLTASDGESLRVSDDAGAVVCPNVAVGEVWIASGQSNMEFPLRDLREFDSLSQTTLPAIRLFGVPKISYEGQRDDDDFSEYEIWRPCTPEHLWFYSAAPFYFAVRLYEQYQVPIGIINCSVGGTRAAAWADEALLAESGARIWLEDFARDVATLDLPKYTAEYKANPMNKNQFQDHNPFIDQMWQGNMAMGLKAMSQRAKNMPRMIPVFGPLDRNAPAALFKFMVRPVAPYGVSGVIWYQGESDTLHADVYDEAMAAVIDSWRGLWQEDLPFLMVQLAPYEGIPGFMAAENYGPLRAQQDKVTRDRPHVYVTNVMDAGMRHDIHPKQKKEVGERLALLTRGKVYQEPIVCEAPQVSACEKRGNQIIITLDNCGDGLKRIKPDIGALEVIASGDNLSGYRVSVLKEQLVIRGKALRTAHDITVRYGMRNYCQCNVKNSAGIPVKPFEIRVRG